MAAKPHDPFGIAMGPGDVLYIADRGSNRIHLLKLSNGIITTAAS